MKVIFILSPLIINLWPGFNRHKRILFYIYKPRYTIHVSMYNICCKIDIPTIRIESYRTRMCLEGNDMCLEL